MNDANKTLVLIAAAKKIQSLGFEFWIAQPSGCYPTPVYGYVTDKEHKNIGNVSVATFGYGINFGTMHKPSIVGTGFGITHNDGDYYTGFQISQITKELVKESFAIAPSWANPKDYAEAAKNKYKSFEDFMNSNRVLKNPVLLTKQYEAELKKIVEPKLEKNMETRRVFVKATEEEFAEFFKQDDIVLVKLYEKFGESNTPNKYLYMMTIRYPELLTPIKEGTDFETIADLKKVIRSRRRAYNNKMEKKLLK